MKFSNIFKYFLRKKIKIIGLTRIRNEELIINDTLDSLSRYVDGIIVYDDCSTDNTLNICKNHPKVLEIIENKRWKTTNRNLEETRSRQVLLETAKKYKAKWLIYVDADERLLGDIKKLLLSKETSKIDGIRVRLFDAYMTENDQDSYVNGKLINFRKYFGPEFRDILMIWKNKHSVKFVGIDAREPFVNGKIITKFYCQHYGKSLSIKHWEETCDYYSSFFPAYAEKWKKRKGKAIHTLSDFNSPLVTWDEVIKL